MYNTSHKYSVFIFVHHIYHTSHNISMPRCLMSAKCPYMGWEGDREKDMLEEVEDKCSGLSAAIEKLKDRNREMAK